MGAALFRIDDAASPVAGPCALVVGNFDGVHRGHAAVLQEAVEAAKAASLATSVLTFEPHPASVVGSGAPPRLTTLERRAELMGELGVDSVFVRRFDAAFAAWAPERFVRELVVAGLHARIVVVGQNFRFGAKRAGDLALLRKLGSELGFDVRIHATAADAKGPYSSTRVREAIAAGDVGEAASVLGRPHSLSGPVVRGDERGRTIGFRTANLEAAEMLPADGVYKTLVDEVGAGGGGARRLATGVTNVGVRPKVGGGKRTVETHLLDFDRDLYGATIRVHFIARLRGEKRFGSLDELKAQIARDVEAARK